MFKVTLKYNFMREAARKQMTPFGEQFRSGECLAHITYPSTDGSRNNVLGMDYVPGRLSSLYRGTIADSSPSVQMPLTKASSQPQVIYLV